MWLEVKCNNISSLVPVLTGAGCNLSVNKMSQKRLESFVSRLLQFSTKKGRRYIRPKWWPDYLKFHHSVPLLGKQVENYNLHWNSILRDLIFRCSQFHKLEPMQIHIPLIRQNLQPRRVLTCKQNNENIIAGGVQISKKRKLESTLKNVDNQSNKRRKGNALTTPCTVVLNQPVEKINTLERRCLNTQSFIRLYDICKEIPCTKEEEKLVSKTDFMNAMGLHCSQPNPYIQVKNFVKQPVVRLCNVLQIPFSSDCGRVLRNRETYDISEQSHARRLERIEWHLKDHAVPTSNQEYEVSYVDKQLYSREYVFPEKIFSQRHTNFQETFSRYVCKPVCVKLKRIDITQYVAKDCESRSLQVVLPNIETVQRNKRDKL